MASLMVPLSVHLMALQRVLQSEQQMAHHLGSMWEDCWAMPKVGQLETKKAFRKARHWDHYSAEWTGLMKVDYWVVSTAQMSEILWALLMGQLMELLMAHLSGILSVAQRADR